MRVLHIISSISRTGGGPSRSVQGLVSGLQQVGVDTHLLAIKPLGEPWVKGVEHFQCIGKMNWFGVSRAIGRIMDEVKPDLVHIHSIWQLMLHFGVVEARRRDIPYILAPRGTLEVWSLRQKWLKKKLALLTYQGRDLSHAAALHVTAKSEMDQCRRLGFQQKIIMSPNGVNAPETMPPRVEAPNGKRRALFLSRMHEKKGLLNLVDSWARVRPVGWELELVYTAKEKAEKDYENQVRSRVQELKLGDSFIFTGALPDEEKWEAYRRADAFILPSYSENFGIVVAEALYAGLPTITTRGTPWQELETEKCGWHIELPGRADRWDEMDSALREMTALSDEERYAMGERGRKLVESKYSWTAIASGMKIAYMEFLNRDK